MKLGLNFCPSEELISASRVGEPTMVGDSVRVSSGWKMAQQAVSVEIKHRIPFLYYTQWRSVQEITGILNIKKSCIYDTLNHAISSSVPYKPQAQQTGSRILSSEEQKHILSLIKTNPSIYLDEIQRSLFQICGIQVSLSTICRTLQYMWVSRKRVSKCALEQDERRRAAWFNIIYKLAPDPRMLMFVDESSKDECMQHRPNGWSAIGMRCESSRCFIRRKRYSIIPVLTLDGIITHDIVQGSVTSARFVQFLEELVVSDFSVSNDLILIFLLNRCHLLLHTLV